MYVVLKRPWRGYPAREPIDMPASDARSALNSGVGVHGTEWKERHGEPETASRTQPEDTSARRTKSDYGSRCGYELNDGSRCSRETGGGRCWQHEGA